MSTLVTATVKSNSSSPIAFQNSSGTEIGTMCRAWVNFNGTGTVAIRAQFNVSSITDNGTGLYTLNFTTAMPDANYIVTGSTVGNATNEGQIVTGAQNSSSQSTSSAQFAVMFCANAARGDVGQVNAAVFR